MTCSEQTSWASSEALAEALASSEDSAEDLAEDLAQALIEACSICSEICTDILAFDSLRVSAVSHMSPMPCFESLFSGNSPSVYLVFSEPESFSEARLLLVLAEALAKALAASLADTGSLTFDISTSARSSSTNPNAELWIFGASTCIITRITRLSITKALLHCIKSNGETCLIADSIRKLTSR